MKSDCLGYKNYSSYLFAHARSTQFFQITDRIVRRTKKFFFLGKLIRLTAAVVAVIETSAALLFAFTLFLTLLPLLITFAFLCFLADRIRGNHLIRRLSPFFVQKKIIVLFRAGEFGHAWMKELEKKGYAVVFVTDKLFPFFLTAKEKNGILMVRRTFFFRLQKTFFENHPERMIYLFDSFL